MAQTKLMDAAFPQEDPKRFSLVQGHILMPCIRLGELMDARPLDNYSSLPLLARSGQRQSIVCGPIDLPLKRKCEGGDDNWSMETTDTCRKRAFVWSHSSDRASWVEDLVSVFTMNVRGDMIFLCHVIN